MPTGSGGWENWLKKMHDTDTDVRGEGELCLVLPLRDWDLQGSLKA